MNMLLMYLEGGTFQTECPSIIQLKSKQGQLFQVLVYFRCHDSAVGDSRHHPGALRGPAAEEWVRQGGGELGSVDEDAQRGGGQDGGQQDAQYDGQGLHQGLGLPVVQGGHQDQISK